MTDPLRPARVPPPGAALNREFEARGFTLKDFAEIIGRPEMEIRDIVQGTKRLNVDNASAFATALGASAELWLELQAQCDLWLNAQHQVATSSAVSRKPGFLSASRSSRHSDEYLEFSGRVV